MATINAHRLLRQSIMSMKIFRCLLFFSSLILVIEFYGNLCSTFSFHLERGQNSATQAAAGGARPAERRYTIKFSAPIVTADNAHQ